MPLLRTPRALLLVTAIMLFPTIGSTQENADSLHRTFDAVLKAHVANGVVDYNGLAGDPRFAAYVKDLEQTDAQKLSSRDERLVFWINAYNALTMQGILNGSSPKTFFGKIGFFYNDKYAVGGLVTNLYDLEHKILRPLGEPRIHFAIVCASQSCPALRAEAFNIEHLDQQLEDSARKFINDTTRNIFDREKKLAQLSKIFDWFDKDFMQHSGSVAKYVARYVSDPELAQALNDGQYKIKYLEYLWGLNGTPAKAAKK